MVKEIKSSGVVTFREGKDHLEVLLLDYGEYFSHPKGNIEDGESLEETAIRELREETNLEPLVMSTNPIKTIHYSYDTPKGELVEKTVYFFAGLVDNQADVELSFEHGGYKWIHPRHAKTILEYDNDIDAVKEGLVWMDKDNKAAQNLARNLSKMR